MRDRGAQGHRTRSNLPIAQLTLAEVYSGHAKFVEAEAFCGKLPRQIRPDGARASSGAPLLGNCHNKAPRSAIDLAPQTDPDARYLPRLGASSLEGTLVEWKRRLALGKFDDAVPTTRRANRRHSVLGTSEKEPRPLAGWPPRRCRRMFLLLALVPILGLKQAACAFTAWTVKVNDTFSKLLVGYGAPAF